MKDLKEFPLDEKFCSAHSSKEKPSVIHTRAIERQKELIGKSTPLPIRDYMPPPQEAPKEEYAIRSPPLSFMSLIKSIINSPCMSPSPSPFKSSSNEESLAFNEKVLKKLDTISQKL